jgi:hypothetical protein
MKILLSIFGAASLFGCSSVEQIKKNEKVEPAHAIALGLKQSTICEVYMVDDSYPNGRQIENGEPLHGYGMLSKPITLPKNNIENLIRVLTDTPDCLFRPGVAFRFNNGGKNIELLVCFSCNELRYYMDCHIIGLSYFKSKELLKLTKSFFPENKKIQSLK